MADTNFRGPISNMGAMEQQSGTAATIEPMDGPMLSYQGYGVLDLQDFPFVKDGLLPGRQDAYLHSSFWTVDNAPQASATNVIAAVQASLLTANASMALATVGVAGANAGNPSIAVAVPIVPQGTTSVKSVIAIDFGFTTGTTTANSSTVNCADNTQLSLGQWIVIGNVGNSANTASLITQVTAISTSNLTGINVNPVPLATLGNAPIGQANLFGSNLIPLGTQFGPTNVTPVSLHKVIQAGIAAIHNPRENLCRALSVSLTTGGTATAIGFLVTGYDVRRNLMTELITSPATTSATVTFGKKAFKFLQSVQQTIPTTGNTYSVGLADTFGFPIRADTWAQTEIVWNNAAMVNANGFTTAAVTSPATNTTGDTRGTVQISTTGGLGTSVAAAPSNGTARLSVMQNVGVWNMVYATPNNIVPMFGVAQSTT
jgi:hypothetical protein